MVKKTKNTKATLPKKDKEKDVGGRPTLLTEEVIAKIVQAVSIGSSYSLAAKWAGISLPTLENWLRIARAAKAKAEADGEKALDPTEAAYLMFLRRVEEAEATAGISWQQVVMRSTRNNAEDALAMLRLRFTGYTPAAPVNYTANIDYSKLTDEQLQRLANGEDPAVVLANSGGGDAGIAPAAKPQP